MTQATSPHRPYLHGTDASERRRLEAQAELLGGDTFLPEVTPGMRLIDVGCGTGAIARRLAPRVAPGTVFGVDREPEQIAAARELAANVSAHVMFEIASAERLPHADGSFDGAYSRFLLEHVPDPSHVIAEMVRVVRAGSWVCALEWEPDGLVMYPDCPNVLDLWQSIYRLQASTGVDPRVGRKLYSLFRDAGLTAVRADTLSWTVTAGEAEALAQYVSGAREIIGQTRTQLVDRGFVPGGVLESALTEYEAALASPVTFISHVFCRAAGIRA